ncbi:unnamed protein product [Pleuronectes platessa]|uniref:Uncharacterized protein n=1 Tax=Pleuronectes platessa TaxID=8262 RepID=A0A9N7UR25_PLEPL|nr:unnamed protein product [Pleuronectes platessa]
MSESVASDILQNLSCQTPGQMCEWAHQGNFLRHARSHLIERVTKKQLIQLNQHCGAGSKFLGSFMLIPISISGVNKPLQLGLMRLCHGEGSSECRAHHRLSHRGGHCFYPECYCNFRASPDSTTHAKANILLTDMGALYGQSRWGQMGRQRGGGLIKAGCTRMQ